MVSLYIVKIICLRSMRYSEKSYFGITSYFYSAWIPYFEPRSPRAPLRKGAISWGPQSGPAWVEVAESGRRPSGAASEKRVYWPNVPVDSGGTDTNYTRSTRFTYLCTALTFWSHSKFVECFFMFAFGVFFAKVVAFRTEVDRTMPEFHKLECWDYLRTIMFSFFDETLSLL